MSKRKYKRKLAIKIFEQGCAFGDCAAAFEHENHKPEIRFMAHIYSTIANEAISCEIYLKALIYMEKGRLIKNNHKLKTLWEKYQVLNKNQSSMIETYMKSLFQTANVNFFSDKLSEISDAFICWRYEYEGSTKKLNRIFLVLFRKVLRDVCCYKIYKQTWKDYVMTHG